MCNALDTCTFQVELHSGLRLHNTLFPWVEGTVASRFSRELHVPCNKRCNALYIPGKRNSTQPWGFTMTWKWLVHEHCYSTWRHQRGNIFTRRDTERGLLVTQWVGLSFFTDISSLTSKRQMTLHNACPLIHTGRVICDVIRKSKNFHLLLLLLLHCVNTLLGKSC